MTVPEANEVTCQRFYNSHLDSITTAKFEERVSFSEAQAQIRDYLHTKAMCVALDEYITSLSQDEDIRDIELVA